MKPPSRVARSVRPRLRVLRGDDVALGPGKIDLLRFVGETGSIREAAARLGMSYMRAWTLIRTMNSSFKKPLVEAVRGGKSGGGAGLTATGVRALALYQEMEASCLEATKPGWRQLKLLLND